MRLEEFDYHLPKELIAQEPSKERVLSRLLVVNKDNRTYEDKIFKDITSYFKKGDVLVRNNTKVLPVRLYGTKVETKAKVEVLLLKETKKDIWECLVGNARTVKVGTNIVFKENVLSAECIEIKEEGIRVLRLKYQGIFVEVLNEVGHMPLPPYIQKQLLDNDRYQTVYAKISGSSAAPTAGFHFNNELFEKLKNKGVEIVDITLHIGLGTFKPVKEDKVEKHKMHEEFYIISKQTAEILNKAKSEGRRIIALGTTSVRTLEANIQKYGKFFSSEEDTNIFIYPGYKFKAIDGMITNFHLPKSTLIMLVSSFIGLDFTLELYCHAVEKKYRFFSFGDAMFIYGK